MSRKEWKKARKCAEELVYEANRALVTAALEESGHG